MDYDIPFIARVDAQLDVDRDYQVSKEERGKYREKRIEWILNSTAQAERQQYYREYTKAYRQFKKAQIGQAKKVLDFHGYTVKERWF